MTRLTQEKKFSLQCVQDGQKDERKKSETFQDTSVQCSNGSDVSRKKAPVCWMTWRITGIESSFLPMKNCHRWVCLRSGHSVEKQNDRVVAFGNDVSEHRRVSTTMQSASIMMFGGISSNGKRKPPVWSERGYGLSSAVSKEVLETKVLLWVKKISQKSD